MLHACKQLADKNDAGMLNVCEQVANKDDAGMLNMCEQLADKAGSRHAQHARAARGQGLGAGMLNVSEQARGQGRPGRRHAQRVRAALEQGRRRHARRVRAARGQGRRRHAQHVLAARGHKGGAGMLNMREQLADKDDAGMLNMCEQLADEDELCGQVVLGSSRPWSAYLTRLPLQNTQPNWTATSTWRTTSGASTAARCDTRPVYCSAADTARLLRQGNQESWAVW